LYDGEIDVDHILKQFWRWEALSRASIHHILQGQLKVNAGVATAV
jgi:hypothetical protein